jgi:hypothetical protein
MRLLFLLASLFFAFIAEVQSAPKFNAMDQSDTHFAVYQAGLCQATYAEYQRFYADRYWKDVLDPKMGVMSPARREDWVEDYVVTTELRDAALRSFDANCR